MTRSALLVSIVVCVAASACAQSNSNVPAGTAAPTAPATSSPASLPTQSPASTKPTNGLPSSDKFCANNSKPEVKLFCPWLSELMRTVKSESSAGKKQDEIKNDIQNDLGYLDPATEEGTNPILDTVIAISLQNALQSAAKGVLQAANQMNTNQQLGAVNSAAGTTSLVSKAGSAALMNLALDSGALTRSVNGATATLSTNADEIFELVTGSPEYNFSPTQSAFEAHILNPLSLSASFAVAQTSSTTAPTAGQASSTTQTSVSSVAIPTGAGKLTSFTAKYQIPNKFDPRSNKFKAAWTGERANLKPLELAAASAGFSVINELEKDSNFGKLAKAGKVASCEDAVFNDALKQDSANLMKDFDNECWQAELGSALTTISPSLQTAADSYVSAQATLRTAYKAAVLDAAGTMFSLQYTFNKPLDQPQTHDLTMIYGYNFGQRGSVTFNGAASIYNGELPAGAKYGRIHYGQASAEYDRNLNNATNSLQSQLSLAGYWQYQPQPSILNIPAGTVAPGTTIPLPNGTQEFVGTAGSLWVTQAKITIKGPDGVNIPVGVSWSNKTDLLQGNKVGAQVGLSYNFSSLAGLFNGH